MDQTASEAAAVLDETTWTQAKDGTWPPSAPLAPHVDLRPYAVARLSP